MDNDVSRRNIIGYQGKVQFNSTKTENQTQAVKKNNINNNTQNTDAMAFLGTMGYAQVKMGQNSIRNSVMSFCADPYNAKAQIDFQDSLMKNNGYDIWKAMKISDSIFKGLSDKSTYRN